MAKRKSSSRGGPATSPETNQVRIIGGKFRGRVLAYSGDPRTRPMKDRVREALFNLLADRVKGRAVLDLFAGTGALGFEALSRGAASAVFLERHYPTARLIQKNVDALHLSERATVVPTDTFFWVRHDWEPGPDPMLIFCSPPYDYYLSRQQDVLAMLERLAARAPAGSTIAVECDERFDTTLLGDPDQWFVRAYPPAVLAIR